MMTFNQIKDYLINYGHFKGSKLDPKRIIVTHPIMKDGWDLFLVSRSDGIYFYNGLSYSMNNKYVTISSKQSYYKFIDKTHYNITESQLNDLIEKFFYKIKEIQIGIKKKNIDKDFKNI